MNALRLSGAFLSAIAVAALLGAAAASRPVLAAPQAVDVCAAIPNGQLPDATVWTAAESPYIVNCDLRVAPAGSSLTIQAGVQVQFATGKILRVEGPFSVEGAGPDSVVFSSQQASPRPGDWKGIEIVKATMPISITGLTLRHAGTTTNPNAPALRLQREGSTLTDVTIEDALGPGLVVETVAAANLQRLRVRRSGGTGLDINEMNGVQTAVTLHNSTFENNVEAVKVSANVQLDLAGNTVQGNKLNGILFDSSSIARPVTWQGGDMPFVISGPMQVAAPLTLQPGVVVKLALVNSGLRVVKDGSVSSVGTAEREIVLTSLADDTVCSSPLVACDTGEVALGTPSVPGPGNWSSVDILAVSMTGSTFSHTIFHYGGSAGSGVAGMLEIAIDGISVSDSKFLDSQVAGLQIADVSATVARSHFANNMGHAIRIDGATPVVSTDNIVEVRDSRFERNGGAVIQAPPNADLRQSGNAVSGDGLAAFSNKLNGILLIDGDITRPITWSAGSLPYVVAESAKIEVQRGTVKESDGRIQTAKLTIEPGAVVKLFPKAAIANLGSEMQIGPAVDGATGTFDASQPKVLVTSILDDACSATDTASGCDTGGDLASTPQAGNWLHVELAGTGRSTVAGAVLRYGGDSSGRGAAVAIKHDKDEVRGSEVSHSQSFGIVALQTSAAFISGSDIHHNGLGGIRGDAATSLGMKLFLSGNRIHDNSGPAIAINANATVVRDTIDRAPGDTANPAQDNILSNNSPDGISVSGTMSLDRVWEPVGLNYVVEQTIRLSAGKTLTIRPGVQVRFKDSTLESPAGSRIVAEGTAEQPIIFTSINEGSADRQPGPGEWIGLLLGGCISASDTSTCSKLSHVQIRYAGGGARNAPSVKVTAAGVQIDHAIIEKGTGNGVEFDQASGKLTDSVVREMTGDGIAIRATTAALVTPDLTNTRVESSKSFIHMDANAQPIVTGTSYADNDVNGILVEGAILRQGPVRWAKANAPYVIGTEDVIVNSNAALLIESGAVIKSMGDGGIDVKGGGALQAPASGGTEPIIMTSIRDDSACAGTHTAPADKQASCDTNNDGDGSAPTFGDWRGLTYANKGSGFNLDNVDILYAGQKDQAILVDGDRAVIKNTRIRWSLGHGVVVRVPTNVGAVPLHFENNLVESSVRTGLSLAGQWEPTTYRILVKDNRFVRNGRSVEHRARSPIDFVNNVAVGNDADAMLYCSEVGINQTWSKDLVREMDCALAIKQALTLEPGTVVMLAESGMVRVEGAGKLVAEGAVLTAADANAASSFWSTLTVAKGNTGGADLRHNLFLHGGKGSGAVLNLAAESPSIQVLYNLFLRSSGFGMIVGATRNDKVTLAGNVIQDVAGSSDTMGIRVDNQAVPSIHHNRIVGAKAGISTSADANPKLDGNSFANISRVAVENTDADRCIEGTRQWWGDPTGPRDVSKAPRDPCGAGLANEGGKGLPVSDNVRYAPWLMQAPPTAPLLLAPQCGVTNQPSIEVEGFAGANASVQAYDKDQPIGQPATTDGAGRFTMNLALASGEHRLSFEASAETGLSDGSRIQVQSPRSSFRRIVVDAASSVDPMGLRFVTGSGGTLREQWVRDVTGCSVSCSGFSGGRVTIPPDTQAKVVVPISGSPARVVFAQPGAPEIPMTIAAGSGLWETPMFLPRQDTYEIRVDGAPQGPCSGFIYVGETGVVFSDTGVVAPPAFSEDFESGTLSQWVADGSWAVIPAVNEPLESGRFVLTDSPNSPYGVKVDTKVTLLQPVNLLAIPSPQLTFSHRYRMAAGDTITLEASTNGESFEVIKSWQSVSSGWKPEIIPLDKYAKETQVQFLFRLRSDGNANTVDEGWTIDNIKLGAGGRGNNRFDRFEGPGAVGEPPVDDATVLLKQRDPDSGEWRNWTPPPGGNQVNPQNTDGQGRYAFYGLAPGEYRAEVTSRKYGVRATDIVPIWDGVFAREIPIQAGEPIYLPTVRKGTQ